MGIPAKSNAHSERKRTAFRDDPEHPRSVAKRRLDADAGMGVWGKGQQSLASPSAGETRSAISAPQLTGLIHTMPLIVNEGNFPEEDLGYISAFRC